MPATPEAPINSRSIVKLARAYDAARTLGNYAKTKQDMVRGRLIAELRRRGVTEAAIEDVVVRLHRDEKRVFSQALARQLYLGPQQYEACKEDKTVERLDVQVARPVDLPTAFNALAADDEE